MGPKQAPTVKMQKGTKMPRSIKWLMSCTVSICLLCSDYEKEWIIMAATYLNSILPHKSMNTNLYNTFLIFFFFQFSIFKPYSARNTWLAKTSLSTSGGSEPAFPLWTALVYVHFWHSWLHGFRLMMSSITWQSFYIQGPCGGWKRFICERSPSQLLHWMILEQRVVPYSTAGHTILQELAKQQ